MKRKFCVEYPLHPSRLYLDSLSDADFIDHSMFYLKNCRRDYGVSIYKYCLSVNHLILDCFSGNIEKYLDGFSSVDSLLIELKIVVNFLSENHYSELVDFFEKISVLVVSERAECDDSDLCGYIVDRLIDLVGDSNYRASRRLIYESIPSLLGSFRLYVDSKFDLVWSDMFRDVGNE